ncbi:hypothetical protein ACFQGT_01985 [Natrialbaceae archaeon GCM10025810]|uniref:hypothetical protein n=1 Tax=Halovalidus salilacus TaxID=3075124 RepID=UPI00360FF469
MSPPRPGPHIVEPLSHRRDLLERLLEGPATKPVLVDDLDCFRSTVDRAVRELEDLGFVAREGGTHRITAAGRLAVDQYRDCVGALESVEAATDLLAYVPPDAPLSLSMLEGARTWTPQPHAPNEAFEEIEHRLPDADRLRGCVAAERIPTLRTRL